MKATNTPNLTFFSYFYSILLLLYCWGYFHSICMVEILYNGVLLRISWNQLEISHGGGIYTMEIGKHIHECFPFPLKRPDAKHLPIHLCLEPSWRWEIQLLVLLYDTESHRASWTGFSSYFHIYSKENDKNVNRSCVLFAISAAIWFKGKKW